MRHPHHNDCKTSMTLVRIPVIPLKFGIFSNTFLVETWFYFLLGGFFKHFTWFQIYMAVIYHLTPSMVIKWKLQMSSITSFIDQFFQHPRQTVRLQRQQFFKTTHRFLFGATILILKGITFYHLLFGTTESVDMTPPTSRSVPSVVNLDPDLLHNDLLQTTGLFQSSPTCFMAGFDLSAVVASAMQAILFNTGDPFPLVFDTGTSHTLTSCRGDFVSFKSHRGTSKVVQGIAAGLDIEGSGQVEYVIHDKQGSPILLTLDAYYMPKLHPNLQLLSPLSQKLKTLF